MEEKKYIINIVGCDDETTFVMELTEYEASIILEVARKSQETSTYGCMPKMYIEEYTKENVKKYSYYFIEKEGLLDE